MTLSHQILAQLALKGAVWLMLACIAGTLIRRFSAATRYLLWLSAFAGAGLLTLAVLVLPAWQVVPHQMGLTEILKLRSAEEERLSTTEGDSAIEEAESRPYNVHVAASVERKSSTNSKTNALKKATAAPTSQLLNPQKLRFWLPRVWLGVAMVMLLRLMICLLRLQRLEKRCEQGADSPALSNAVLEIAMELNLPKRLHPKLLLGPAHSAPMVWGLTQPRLLLPAEASDWSSNRLRVVLLHELAHLQRRDPAALLLGQLVSALHWFNPLAWLTLKRFRSDQEQSCDDAVLRHGVRPSEYAQHLLDLSQHQRLAPGIGLCALALDNQTPIQQRLLAILNPRIRRAPASGSQRRFAVLLTLLIALPLAMLAQAASHTARGRLLDRHGIVLAQNDASEQRSYPLKALASHVLGYARRAARTSSRSEQMFGATGLEKTQDQTLAAGKDVSTSLDARVQSIATRAMAEAGVGRGAAVVLDPRTGEVLAMVSLPDFDAKDFTPTLSQEQFDRFSNDKTIPLLNRAINAYSPGSAYKPFVALAALTQGLGNEKFECTGSVTCGSKNMQCWIARQFGGKHGVLSLDDAIMRSCNCYFYQLGNRTGLAGMGKVGHQIGIGEKTHIQLPDESPGVLPTSEWMQLNQPNEAATNPVHIANTSIGQGFVLTTPLQMAVVAATVATAGKVPSVSLLPRTEPIKSQTDLIKNGVSPEQMERIRKGMWQVVNHAEGTAKSARVPGTEVAGKTGTAQFWRVVNGEKIADNHTWFIGFAPYKNPTLAFAILVQNGKSGGGTCAPIAKRIIEETLSLPADGSGKVDPMEVHQGHFNEVVSSISSEEAHEATIKTLRQAASQTYDIIKTPLAEVLRFLATDSGIRTVSLPEDAPEAARLITFNQVASPFSVLETLCKANGLTLILESDIWYIRSANDPELLGKAYPMPVSKATPEAVLNDLRNVLDLKDKTATTKWSPKVLWKPVNKEFYVLATRLQHTWVQSYMEALRNPSASTKP